MAGYKLKEVFYTLQGEGYFTGRPAVFVRFTGCNLWTGLEKDRPKAICQFCDTDFVGMDGLNGGKYSASELVDKIQSLWPKDSAVSPFVVCTGGEPGLQLDDTLVRAMKEAGIYIAIETNGTVQLPEKIDWICLSPKAHTDIVLKKASEVKLVYPQEDIHPLSFEDFAADHFFLQPMDSPTLRDNTDVCIAYCKNNPKWRLSMQTHKVLRIP